MTSDTKRALDWLSGVRARVEEYLRAHCTAEQVRIRRSFGSDTAAEIIDELANRCCGGRMLRAGLVELGYRVAHGQNVDSVLPLQAAVEILHTAILMHDDVIDRSPLRRGKPTTHESWAEKHRRLNYSGHAERFGDAMGILIGDIGCFMGMELALSCGLSEASRLKAIEFLNGSLLDTGFGELLDVELAARTDVREEEIDQMITFKTARYTIVAPLQLGGEAGGLERVVLQTMDGFGVPLGQAYQLRDDYLGIFGDEAKLGKPVLSDLREGKKTLLWLWAMKASSDSDRSFLRASFGNPQATANDLERVRSILRRADIDAVAKKQIKNLTAKATKIIPGLTRDAELQAYLRGLCEFVAAIE